MAANPLPDKNDKLFTLAHDMKDGLHRHEVEAGVSASSTIR